MWTWASSPRSCCKSTHSSLHHAPFVVQTASFRSFEGLISLDESGVPTIGCVISSAYESQHIDDCRMTDGVRDQNVSHWLNRKLGSSSARDRWHASLCGMGRKCCDRAATRTRRSAFLCTSWMMDEWVSPFPLNVESKSIFRKHCVRCLERVSEHEGSSEEVHVSDLTEKPVQEGTLRFASPLEGNLVLLLSWYNVQRLKKQRPILF